jgi:putative sterol carrier protein
MNKKIITLALLFSAASLEATTFMDASWADKVCKAWNQNSTLTTELGKKWVKNNNNRGYKIIQIYRDKCGENSKIQLIISDKEGKAICTKGGKPDGKKTDKNVDYVMHASDKDWTCIGKGSFGCGAMGAMATGKLKFKGPKMEAMSVMGPFGDFLTLTGEIDGDKSTCK